MPCSSWASVVSTFKHPSSHIKNMSIDIYPGILSFCVLVLGPIFRDEQARGTSASSLSDKITAEHQNEILCLYSYVQTVIHVSESQTRSCISLSFKLSFWRGKGSPHSSANSFSTHHPSQRLYSLHTILVAYTQSSSSDAQVLPGLFGSYHYSLNPNWVGQASPRHKQVIQLHGFLVFKYLIYLNTLFLPYLTGR